jgi:hypothetical protein
MPLLFHAVLLLVASICHFPLAAAQEMPSEQSVRAAMVFNFLKFTEFPPEAIAKSAEIRLCMAVRDARQAEALLALAGRKVKGRELIVADFTTQSGECHVFYVDSRQRWNTAAENLTPSRALTISAYPGFARDGGMIEIAIQTDGARFDINLAEGRRAGLRFSPQLLRLARQIHE